MFVCFHLKKMFELNFSAMKMACFSAAHAHFTHYVVRDVFDTSSMGEATSLSMNLFRELFQVVTMIVTKSLRVVSEMIRASYLVLMHCPS